LKSRTDHFKQLMRAVQKTVPDNNPGHGLLVHPDEVEEELDEVREKTALIKKFERYNRADDLLKDFSPQAAKRLVYEMEFGRTSNDRRSAAVAVLDRALGKPVDRVLNITAEINQYMDQELDTSIRTLLGELGYQKQEGETSRKLIVTENPAGPGKAKTVHRASGVSGELSEGFAKESPDNSGEPIR